ncbi:MAG: hypothetical protein HYU56_02715 [Candidatus Aenigmarchaeota archaeon]|nr:hypothetical protein [Candidatus Aenigmarchaeota archaeon]
MAAGTAELADLKRRFGDAVFDAESFAYCNVLSPNPATQALDRYLSLYDKAEELHKTLKYEGAEIPENTDCRMYRLMELSIVIKEARQKHFE